MADRRLVAVEEKPPHNGNFRRGEKPIPRITPRWRIATICCDTGVSGRLSGWSDVWFYTYTGCLKAIEWIEAGGGTYELFVGKACAAHRRARQAAREDD